jgi:hypothetical protein
MIDSDFLTELKNATERMWSRQATNPSIYGFQFQHGTRWMPGLPDQKITAYEDIISTKFPLDFRTFLRAMNGTDLTTLNVFGSSGVAPLQSVGVYSYPRDVEVVKQLIEIVRENRDEIALDLASQGFHLPAEASLVPICGHCYVVCTRKLNTSPILSIVVDDVDAIVYANSLREYLRKDFMEVSPRSPVRLPLEPT